MRRLYWMSTENLNDPAVFQNYYREMSAERRAKIDRARMEQDKRLSLAAGILFDRGLQNEQTESGLCGKNARIKEDVYGKPYLPDFPELHFNLSHSREMAFAVFADTDVGCDIEFRKQPNDKLAGRFFCRDEISWMQDAKEETEQEERFSRLWTLKESFIKATGQGLRLPLDSFCFRIEETCVPQSEMRCKTRQGNIPCEAWDTHAPQSEIGGKTRQGNIPAVELWRRNSSVTVAQSFDQAEYMFEEYRVGRDGEYCAAVCLRYQCL